MKTALEYRGCRAIAEIEHSGKIELDAPDRYNVKFRSSLGDYTSYDCLMTFALTIKEMYIKWWEDKVDQREHEKMKKTFKVIRTEITYQDMKFTDEDFFFEAVEPVLNQFVNRVWSSEGQWFYPVRKKDAKTFPVIHETKIIKKSTENLVLL